MYAKFVFGTIQSTIGSTDCMVDNPRQIPQNNAEQRELVTRAQRRRQDFVRVDGMTSITDRIPTLNSLITRPEALLERIPARVIMHILVIAIIPLALLVSRSNIVQITVDHGRRPSSSRIFPFSLSG